MECSEVIALLDSLLDGELTESDEKKLTAHIDKCPSCKEELACMHQLKNDLKNAGIFSTPNSLFINIKERINEESMMIPSFGSSFRARIKSLLVPSSNPLFTHAGAALFGALLVFIVIQQPFKASTLKSEIFSAHVNSLVGDNLISVKSNDTHTVKPWFAGKIKFAPFVQELGESDFVLLGGRIDNLQDNKVAVLIYLRDKHIINVFISPKINKNIEQRSYWQIKGYNAVNWSDQTFTYSAISDLSAHGLESFSEAFILKTT